MKKVILDTNFLLIPIQEKVDVFDRVNSVIDEKYELCVVEKTIEELNSLISNKNVKVVDRLAAKVGLQLLEKNKLKIIKTGKFNTADDAILSIVDENYLVATRDAEFKRKLKQKGIKIISLKGKNLIIP